MNYPVLPLYFTAVLFYLLAALRIYVDLRKGRLTDGAAVNFPTLALWVVALVLHAFILAQFNTPEGFNFAFFKALSILGALLAGILLLSSHFQRLVSLGIVILPIAAASVALAAFDSHARFILSDASVGIRIHIFTSFLAYGALTLAGVDALAIVAQKRRLHEHRFNTSLKALPSIEALEAFLIHLLTTGVLLLSVGLLSGFLIYENLLAQHLAHKTFFSLIAWLIFVVILWNHFRRRWRGGTIVKLSLWGLGLLIVAYFGSKFVLEFILGV